MSIIDELLDLQELDLQIRESERELKDIPARKELELSRLNEHRAAEEAAEEDLKQRQAKLKNHELQVENQKEKIRKLRQQQMQIKNNKEYKAMESEIAVVERDIRTLEDKELVLMEEIELARQDVASRKHDLAQEDAEVQRDLAVWDERIREVKGALGEVQQQRLEAAAGIDPEWLQHYEMIFARRDRAVVAIQNGVCDGCHMKLPPYIIHASRKKIERVTCDYCGRLVYS